ADRVVAGAAEEVRHDGGAADAAHASGEVCDLRCDARHLADDDDGRTAADAEGRALLATVGERRGLEVVQVVVRHAARSSTSPALRRFGRQAALVTPER